MKKEKQIVWMIVAWHKDAPDLKHRVALDTKEGIFNVRVGQKIEAALLFASRRNENPKEQEPVKVDNTTYRVGDLYFSLEQLPDISDSIDHLSDRLAATLDNWQHISRELSKR